jgi:hypothetical protein
VCPTCRLATVRVIYNITNGADVNGSGVAVQSVVLDGLPTLGYTDVLIFCGRSRRRARVAGRGQDMVKNLH